MPNKRVGLDQASFGRVASAHDPTELIDAVQRKLGTVAQQIYPLMEKVDYITPLNPNGVPHPTDDHYNPSTPADATAVAYKPPIGGNPGNSFAPRPTIDQDNVDSPFSPQNKEKVINRTKELYPGPQQSSAGPVAIK